MQALIRAHARVVSLDDGTMLCRVLGRYPMVVDGRDRGTDPTGLLRAIAARFPLRQLGANTRVTLRSEAEALGRDGDMLLVLTRRAI
jgi:hypothetical protein